MSKLAPYHIDENRLKQCFRHFNAEFEEQYWSGFEKKLEHVKSASGFSLQMLNSRWVGIPLLLAAGAGIGLYFSSNANPGNPDVKMETANKASMPVPTATLSAKPILHKVVLMEPAPVVDSLQQDSLKLAENSDSVTGSHVKVEKDLIAISSDKAEKKDSANEKIKEGMVASNADVKTDEVKPKKKKKKKRKKKSDGMENIREGSLEHHSADDEVVVPGN